MLADVVLVVHFLIVAFIVGGLILTWAGFFLGWQWVRNPAFRYLHVAAIGFVVYLVLRLVSPGTANKVRDMIKGRPAAS